MGECMHTPEPSNPWDWPAWPRPSKASLRRSESPVDINPIAVPLAQLSIPQAIEVAVDDLELTSERAKSKYQYEHTFERIERWSIAMGLLLWMELDEHRCRAFILAKTKHGKPPALNTSRWRRSAINRIYAALRRAGYPAVDQTFLIDLGGSSQSYVKGPRYGRPLTNAEIGAASCRPTPSGPATRTPSPWPAPPPMPARPTPSGRLTSTSTPGPFASTGRTTATRGCGR